jgi:hypothetical protein
MALMIIQPGLSAQDAAATLTIPIRVVDGHIVLLADLVGLRYTDQVSLEIAFDYPDALTLHPDQYAWLGIEPRDPAKGADAPIQLSIDPGITLSIPTKDIVAEPSRERVAAQDRLTKLYSAALGEQKLKGTIGVGLLRKYRVMLDVDAKQLVLAPPRASEDAPADMSPADLVISPFEEVDGRIHVPLTYADDGIGRMAIGGTSYDTLVDASVATSLAKPAGNVSPVWLADSRGDDRKLDLSRDVAFRPHAASSESLGASPTLIAGVNLLEHFRLDVDWQTRTIAFTRKRAAHYPQQDFAFFRAEATGTTAAMRTYLEQYPHERLSAEAARWLVRWRLEKDRASDAEVLQALTWVIDTSLPGRRAESCYEWAETFSTLPGRTALAIEATQAGLQHAREAFDPRIVPALHRLAGEQYLQQGELTPAWKHLLSAAFMMPEDPRINLDLARVYDRQGRALRAYSRYKRAAAGGSRGAEADTEIMLAMDRLRKQLPNDAR